ncbi:MAG TPA: glycine-rich protein [Candidatus Cybelea sp.]
MERFNRSRPVAVMLATGLLVACGSSQPPAAQPFYRPSGAYMHHEKYSFTGKRQSFTVPTSVTTIMVDVEGASGGGQHGGRGGRVQATIPVTPDEHLAIFVAGKGKFFGGFNGGGDGGSSQYEIGHGGGGASDVRQAGDRLADRVVVAGGGGGTGGLAAYGYHEKGGAGGGSTGGTGGCSGAFQGGSGNGGSQTAGGLGGAGGIGNRGDGQAGANGKRHRGGAGGSVPSSQFDTGGGGGGGGYYGGGGGGSGGQGTSGNGCGGGGGGGSSYVEPSAKNVKSLQGVNFGNGSIIIYF